MPIIDTHLCNQMYSRNALGGLQPRTIQHDMLCAGFAEGKKDACQVGVGSAFKGVVGLGTLQAAWWVCFGAWETASSAVDPADGWSCWVHL